MAQNCLEFARKRIYLGNSVNFIAEKFNTDYGII